ncbi:hypothetical protein ACN4EK_12590 [Pantanalinema rosaneae CENA516]|uniref:hypothetical protein n=1 Tax=Pantanalinema rosaneae TaxID=1620701 RepID=UPI003D6DCB31
MTQTNEVFLEQLIKNQYKAAQEMAVATTIYVILAVLALLGLPILFQGVPFDKLAGLLGGSIFSGLGYTPAKEILDRRERARNLEATRPLLQEIQKSDTALSLDEQQKIKEGLLKLIEKTVSN